MQMTSYNTYTLLGMQLAALKTDIKQEQTWRSDRVQVQCERVRKPRTFLIKILYMIQDLGVQMTAAEVLRCVVNHHHATPD